jgi:hypothetical protein|nr:MAG TPA: hypothetical protein [Caudoviricetes sp.]
MVKPPLPGDIKWGDRTAAWWDALDTVPGVDTWSAADWGFALDTALVHRAVWVDGDLSQLKELRMREQALGITPAARKATPTTEAVIEKVTETPLQRITERRIERRSVEGKPTADVSTPPARRGSRRRG